VFSKASITVAACGVFLFTLIFVVSASQSSHGLGQAKGHLRLALVVWWALLVSAEVFARPDKVQEFTGNFSAAAYGEAAFWAVAFLALFLIMPMSQYLRQAFSGSNKWLSLYAVVCLISAPFSPAPLYALAWAFKLLLAVLLLLLCSASMHDLDDIEAFFWANFWGFALVTVMRLARAFIDPSTAFEGGRLTESIGPPFLSLMAGTLLLLALSLNSLRKRAWLVGFGVLGATVMIMAGGKAGIVGGIASVALFYVLQKRFAAGFGWLLGLFALGGIVFAVTPLSTYFTAYQEAGSLSSLTGRTELWRAAWPQIMQRPLIGHGFMASRFIELQVSGVSWEAMHTHNGFLEVLYESGLVGLIILVAIILVTVKNLRRVLKGLPNRKVRLLAIGSGAISINLLINGFFNATFGGQPVSPFILLLGLLVVSEALRRNAQPQALRRSVFPLQRELLSQTTVLRAQTGIYGSRAPCSANHKCKI
jgi:O-antigen ligase